jgi:hypothetical protein
MNRIIENDRARFEARKGAGKATVTNIGTRRDISEALGREKTTEEIVASRPTASKARDELRAKMARETEEFLANGGVIQQIPTGVSGYVHNPRKIIGLGATKNGKALDLKERKKRLERSEAGTLIS